MKKYLTVRVMSAIYIPHKLVSKPDQTPEYDLSKGEVYVSNKSDLPLVLSELSEIIKKKPQFLFCLTWGEDHYYFESNGEYSKYKEGPRMNIK
jgi:hypothetical protein